MCTNSKEAFRPCGGDGLESIDANHFSADEAPSIDALGTMGILHPWAIFQHETKMTMLCSDLL